MTVQGEGGDDGRRTRHIDAILGARLRAMREDRGLTQAEMASQLHISANQWGRHESGVNRVPAARLWQFCQLMGVSVAELYKGLPGPVSMIPRDKQGRDHVGEEPGNAPEPLDLRPMGEPAGTLVQRIGAAARELSEARQRTALAVIRALKAEDPD